MAESWLCSRIGRPSGNASELERRGGFCRWLSRKEGKTYRLPTAAESQWAARAGEPSNYPGNHPDGDLLRSLDLMAWTYIYLAPDRRGRSGHCDPTPGSYSTCSAMFRNGLKTGGASRHQASNRTIGARPQESCVSFTAAPTTRTAPTTRIRLHFLPTGAIRRLGFAS